VPYIVFAFLLLLATPLWAQGEVHEYTLANGMKVIVKVDRRAPVVVQQVWYGVGSRHEFGGVTGVSHVLEHMMFKGTKRYPAGEFSRIIAAEGGRENAFTSRDYTAYYQLLASDRLEVAMRLEADRMRNLTLPPEEFDKEIQVVKEERRLRTDDNPISLTFEHFSAVAYLSSPYGHPVIGWMDDLENMTVEDLRDWYERWYAPNNARLVVVGDVDPKEVLRLAKRYYEPIKARPLPELKPRREVGQRGERRALVKAPAELPYLIVGYKTPVALTAEREWEPYALEVLAAILDGGDSARLSSRLVRGQEVAASAGAGYDAFDAQDGLFLFAGTPAPDRKMSELEDAFYVEVERLQTELVGKEELDRVKAKVVAEEVFQRDSIQHQAQVIGMLETLGLGWRVADEYVARIKAVTPEQVREVAQRYLVADQRTVAMLDPQPIDPDHPPSSFTGHLR
jgi:zinc protease